MKVKNTTRALNPWYYYHFHKILVQFFINIPQTVVFPIQFQYSGIQTHDKSKEPT